MSHLNTYSGQSDASTTVSVSFTVPVTATYAVVLCAMRGSDGGATTLTSVTMGGENFTLDSSTMRRFDSYQAAEAGYMLAADLPSGSVTATATRGAATNGFTIAVLFFDDANQAAPLISLNGASSAPPDPFVTAISPTANATLVDIICTSDIGTVFTVDETGQTETSEEAVSGASVISNTSIRDVLTGSNNMGWDTGGNSSRTSHVVLAINVSAIPPSGIPILRRRLEDY